MSSTLLVISGIAIPPYSARALSQTLFPIAAASQMRRTINGALVDISSSLFRKYGSVISCTDQQHPALNGIWPGLQVTVDCISELSYTTSGGSADRVVVSGSSRTSGTFTFYRPRLTMRVMNYDVNFDEWGASVSWSLSLEEV